MRNESLLRGVQTVAFVNGGWVNDEWAIAGFCLFLFLIFPPRIQRFGQFLVTSGSEIFSCPCNLLCFSQVLLSRDKMFLRYPVTMSSKLKFIPNVINLSSNLVFFQMTDGDMASVRQFGWCGEPIGDEQSLHNRNFSINSAASIRKLLYMLKKDSRNWSMMMLRCEMSMW